MKRVSLSLLALAAAVPALENPIVGPRAMGMGGAQVACAEDYVAQYYNPAAFGFFWSGTDERRADGMGRGLDGSGFDNQDLARKDWGLGVDLTFGARVNGDLSTYADDLLDFNTDGIDSLQTDVTSNPTKAQATINDILKLAASLGGLDVARDAATIQANAGAGVRILGFGVGARVYGEAVAKVAEIDLQNLGAGTTVTSDVATLIAEATSGTGVVVAPTPGYTPTYFSTTQFNSLISTLAAASGLATTSNEVLAAAQGLDSQAADAVSSGTIAADQAAAIAETLVGDGTSTGIISAISNNGDINENETALLIQGVAIAEVPFTYGHAFNDYVSVGASVKYMMGQVSAVKIRAIDTTTTTELSDYFEDFLDDAEESSNVGVDLGVMVRYDFIQAGITARNINSPVFKGPKIRYTRASGTVDTIQVEDVEVKPDIRAGVAVIPFYQWYAGLTLAADMELMKSETALPGYDHQMVGLGAELKVLSTLDLRGGVSKNLAEDDIPMLIHGGVGVNMWLLRIDAAGAMASETVEVDGEDVPKEIRGSFAIATDW